MTTTTINYRDLCAYVDANAHRLPTIMGYVLSSWGELEAPSADALEQARVEATDELVEEFCTDLGIVEGSFMTPHICTG